MDNKKTILITGASAGLGKAVAHRLLDSGQWEVFAGARRVEEMADLAARGARVLKLDVTQEADLAAAAGAMMAAAGRIDALFANAGHGSYGMVEAVAMTEIEAQFDVNVFGVARSLKAVMPHMRHQHAGRIVIAGSILGHLSCHGLGWYAATKHALTAVGTALRQEVRELGIEVVMIEPGAVATDFTAVALERLRGVGRLGGYERLADDARRFIADLHDRARPPDTTVAAVVAALTAVRPKPVYRTTGGARLWPVLASLAPAWAYDWAIRRAIRKAVRRSQASA